MYPSPSIVWIGISLIEVACFGKAIKSNSMPDKKYPKPTVHFHAKFKVAKNKPSFLLLL